MWSSTDVAEAMLDDVGRDRLIWWREQLFEYDRASNRFRPKNETDFDDGVRRFLAKLARETGAGKSVTSLLMHREVCTAIRSFANIPSEYDPPCLIRNAPAGAVIGQRTTHYLPVRNGILDVERHAAGYVDCLLGPTPDVFTTTGVDYPYDPNAKCPRFLNFIEQFTGGDREVADVLQEFVGHCLIPEMRYQKFLVIPGAGGEGKGVFTDIVRNVVGLENCSAMSLKQISTAFGPSGMVGKLVNIADEMNETDRADEATIKTITGGQPVMINPKFKTAYQLKLFVRFIFTTNILPHLNDRSNGIWRRLLLLPVHREWVEEEQDRKLLDKLLEELPGILNWALEGLARLWRQDGFTKCERSRLAVEEFRNECNPPREFVKECLMRTPADMESVAPTFKEVCDAYKSWALRLAKWSVYSDVSIAKEIRQQFPFVKIRHRKPDAHGHRDREYFGIALVSRVEERRKIEKLGLRVVLDES